MELKSKEYWNTEIECQNEFLAKKLRKKLGKVFVKNLHTNLGFESKDDFNEMLELVTDAVWANAPDWNPDIWYSEQDLPWEEIWERWQSPMQRHTICLIAASLIRPRPSERSVY